ncbi:DUF1015 domain-containing protein [Anaerotignum propionicum]|jgi:uncharacterized protein (DUF1015 family)|uniref:DUF1015 domain-containing protein n=1 Tax=Anaerotignum propionicum TaxID=28446 RepID=UPI0028A20D6D|nr:DUF1015 family protein [Anaerotignum propionicum]MEA5056709.1 DUF1015 family protein [Anaerotignum propionicum]
MATIRPFMGIRPEADYAQAVAALPYDVMNSEEAREMVKDKPYSFLHIDKAEVDLPQGIDLYSDAVYAKAKENLESMIAQGVFTQDLLPNLYIYQLTMNGRSQTGLVACTSIDEYLNGTIKKHELTRADKEADRIRHVDTLNANTGPIFLAYKSNELAKTIMDGWKAANPPVYDFVSEDGIGHTVWVIDSDTEIGILVDSFRKLEHFYIADGHHRNASAVKVGLKRREEKELYTGEEEFNYYLSVLFPADELKIMDYNRVVKDLNGHSAEEFLALLTEKFQVTPYQSEGQLHPQKPHQFGMYLEGKWFSLISNSNLISNDPVLSLDVSILQKEVLEPLLAIGDPRTDKRIDFVGGIRGLSELEKRVDSGEMKVAFSLYPTSMEELMNVADADLIMPPKSTWFEPKLRSGLFLHDLGE